MVEYVYFRNLDLNDSFFDSLKNDYTEFSAWFNRKATEGAKAYILNEGGLQAFLYLKLETESLDDIVPPLAARRRLKIGTMKINPHGTRLGERFLKIAINAALQRDIHEIYVTAFSHHTSLINLFVEFGFNEVAKKTTPNGQELVLLKNLSLNYHDILKDFPNVNTNCNKFLLSIYPQYHTILFPDSKLSNENEEDIILDVSHTNSIHKIYICRMPGVQQVQRGDNIIIYRTVDQNSEDRPWFKSVATTLCVAEEVKIKSEFSSIDGYLDYCKNYSIFSESDLRRFYRWDNLIVIKFLYNISFTKRVNMKKLVEEAGLNRTEYWGFRQLSDNEFFNILNLGQINNKILR